MTVTSHHSTEINSRFPLISWGAVFAGILLTLVFSWVMNVLGTAIGGAAFTSMYEKKLQILGVGAGLWLIFSGVISTAVGAYLAGTCAPARGCIHGVLVWAGSVFVTIVLLSAAITGASSAAFGAIGKGLSLTGQGLSGSTSYLLKKGEEKGADLDLSGLRSRFESVLQKSQGARLNSAKVKDKGTQFIEWAQRIAQESKPTLSQRDKETLTQLIASGTDRSHDQAQQIANEAADLYQQAFAQYQKLRKEAGKQMHQAVTTTAEGVMQAAWWMFVVLVLSAVVAAAAGHWGYRQQSL